MRQGISINEAQLAQDYPTHLHSKEFWEALGRAVATFGFLEETLAKAIFALSATSPVPDGTDPEAAVIEWIKSLERTVSDPLGPLIGRYEKLLRNHPEQRVEGIDHLIADLRRASEVRNAICHGSWGKPDAQGKSLPFFIDRNLRKIETPFDAALLDQLRSGTVGLACSVMNTVTHMGYQFPSSAGPGEPIMQDR